MSDPNDEIFLDDGQPKQKKPKGKISRMRNLTQYRDLSDDQFAEAMKNKEVGMEHSEALEVRIDKKLKEFEDDYDLSDMKINDRDALRALIQAQITLEDYEQLLFSMRKQSLTESTFFMIEKLQKAMSDLRSDISKFQYDLNITRKIRKSDQDASVLAYMATVKDKAKRFYESKMSYIFCPKCDMLLATVWTMYPSDDRNKITLTCGRVHPDGTACGHKITVGTNELLKGRGTNKKEITPESFL